MRISQMTSTKTWLAQRIKLEKEKKLNNSGDKEISGFSTRLNNQKSTDNIIHNFMRKLLNKVRKN